MAIVNQHINDFLDYYLNLNEPRYAVLLSGKWGSGKTHFIEQFRREHSNIRVVKISLFGLKSKDDIHKKIVMEQFAFPKTSEAIAKNLNNVFEKLTGLNLNLSLSDISVESAIKQVKTKKIVFIFDDIAMSYFGLMIKKGINVTPPPKQDFLNALNQSDSKVLHQKNMKYVTALLNKGLIDKVSENELKKLFVYYASVGEVDGTKVFIDHGMCQKYPNLCTQAIETARINNFTEIEKLIKENK